MNDLNQLIKSLVSEIVVPVVRDEIKNAFQERNSYLTREEEDPDTLYSAKDAAEYLGKSISTMYRYSSQGIIQSYGSGKPIGFKKHDLDEHKNMKRPNNRLKNQEDIDVLRSFKGRRVR